MLVEKLGSALEANISKEHHELLLWTAVIQGVELHVKHMMLIFIWGQLQNFLTLGAPSGQAVVILPACTGKGATAAGRGGSAGASEGGDCCTVFCLNLSYRSYRINTLLRSSLTLRSKPEEVKCEQHKLKKGIDCKGIHVRQKKISHNKMMQQYQPTTSSLATLSISSKTLCCIARHVLFNSWRRKKGPSLKPWIFTTYSGGKKQGKKLPLVDPPKTSAFKLRTMG